MDRPTGMIGSRSQAKPSSRKRYHSISNQYSVLSKTLSAARGQNDQTVVNSLRGAASSVALAKLKRKNRQSIKTDMHTKLSVDGSATLTGDAAAQGRFQPNTYETKVIKEGAPGILPRKNRCLGQFALFWCRLHL
jgi:hypothetical protein